MNEYTYFLVLNLFMKKKLKLTLVIVSKEDSFCICFICLQMNEYTVHLFFHDFLMHLNNYL